MNFNESTWIQNKSFFLYQIGTFLFFYVYCLKECFLGGKIMSYLLKTLNPLSIKSHLLINSTRLIPSQKKVLKPVKNDSVNDRLRPGISTRNIDRSMSLTSTVTISGHQ